jgi:ribosomal protein S18 acetylase RimI-like enzyme
MSIPQDNEEPLCRIRRAVGEDSGVVADMARTFHAEDGHPLSDLGLTAVLAMLAPNFDQGVILILEVEGGIAGYGMLSFGYGVEHGGRETFVEDIFVKPAWRNRGFGGVLLEALEAHARLAGCKAVLLEVMPNNPAERLYRRAGYGDRGSLLMKKVL